jgi:putative component of membrane protein insertase Oxa1/YidC/SpoIIIJ protein YidD
VACDYEPSCSEYTRQAIGRFGLIRGLRLGLARLRRCDGRHRHHRIADPVPER